MASKLPNPIIGTIKCCTPGCGASCKLRAADQGEGFVYYVCSECSCQHFARGPRSDSKMRAAMTQPAAPAPTPAAQPAPPKKETASAEKTAQQPAAQPAARKRAGIAGW